MSDALEMIYSGAERAAPRLGCEVTHREGIS